MSNSSSPRPPFDSHDRPPDRPQLRLFCSDEAGQSPSSAALSPLMTLRQFFEAYVLPTHLSEAKPRNIQQYRETLGYWARFTADPPLIEIDTQVCLLFQEGLKTLIAKRTGQPIADNTRRKHVFHVQHCLDLAGPSEDNDEWQSLFGYTCKICRPRIVRRTADFCPVCRLPLIERKRPLLCRPSLVINEVNDNFTVAEIADYLDHCGAAIAPRIAGLTTALWHHSAALVAYNVGFRIETLTLLEFAWLAQDDWGWWLNVPGWAIKKHRGRAFYVNAWALAAIQRVRPAGEWDARAKIFAWPHTESWLHEQRRRILAATQIAENRRFGFHGFRKACCTELSAISPAAGKMQMGHAGDVTIDHYTHRKVLVEAHKLLPQPPVQREAPGRDPQQRFFAPGLEASG